MMRFIGIIATIVFIWWAANCVAAMLIMATCGGGETGLMNMIGGIMILKYVNIVAAVLGAGWLLWKAFGEEKT